MGLSANKKYPKFFEVFLPEHSSESLRIPDAFLEHVNHKLPKKVVLRSPDGNLWSMEVAEIDNCLFFQEGWPKLVSENSLQVGEFLIFQYDGYRTFDILILATTGCKKEQAENSLPTQEEEEEEEEQQQQQQDDHDDDGEREENENRERDEAESSVGSKRHQGRGPNYSVSGYCGNKLPEGIRGFLPSNGNPFFVTKLRKTSGELNIPYEIREDFGLKFSDGIKLQDPAGRFWRGRIKLWKDGRVWVKYGWKKLCKWNMVTTDDWLICEFLPSRRPTREVIKVLIIRAKDLKGETCS